ncbi:ARM repeat-containing protein [Gigaspora margarita]|uniref:ARM repeat-containing protein n=1 Tax=Gigaspora margarita TaxID=4874 RepID=A0A8H4B5K8_GIGMA|nr:ARM repeat-containing protein [Gigaspora margarita]
MDNNEISRIVEKIELQFCHAENEVQFEEKLKFFLGPVLKKLASPHKIVRKKAIEILNHIKKRMTNTVRLPWNSLIEIVHSDNFMNSIMVKNFTIVYLKTAYDRLTEKDKITYLSALIKNIELKPLNQKKFLFQIILELLPKLSLKLSDLETKEVNYVLKLIVLIYHLNKLKLLIKFFLGGPKTEINLQKQGIKFIQWINRMVDTSRLELIGRVLLFGLLNIIKDTKIEKFNNLLSKQEINQTLLFRPFYSSLNLSIHNPEEAIDNEILKEIVIKFQEINHLDQFNQWTNEENVQAIINILEENIDEVRSLVEIFKLSCLALMLDC